MAEPVDLDAVLSTVIKRAPGLRSAGVTTITIDGVSFALAPPEVVPTRAAIDDVPDEDYSDPLDDPKTYGRMTGTPGFQRPRNEGGQP